MFMSKPKIYIDGKEGTTGLQIYDRLTGREDIRLLLIDEDKRKDTAERKKLMDEADLVFLCLPDEAAVEAIKLVENPRLGLRLPGAGPGAAGCHPDSQAGRQPRLLRHGLYLPGCTAGKAGSAVSGRISGLPCPVRLYRRREKGHRPVRRRGARAGAGQPQALRRDPIPQAHPRNDEGLRPHP